MGDASRVLVALDKLTNVLGAAPANPAAARRLQAAVLELEQSGASVEQVDARELSSKLAAVGDAMSRLGLELGQSDGPHAAASLPLSTLGLLCEAACRAFARCCLLAALLGRQLPRQEAFRLAAGASLVLHSSTLRRSLHEAAGGRSASERHGAPTRVALAALQLNAVFAAVQWLKPAAQAELAGAWVRTAGRPAAVLPWLSALVELLSAGHDGTEGCPNIWHCSHLTGVCSVLLRGDEAFRPYQAALAAAPGTQAALLGVMVRQVLPCVRAALEAVYAASGGSGGQSSTSTGSGRESSTSTGGGRCGDNAAGSCCGGVRLEDAAYSALAHLAPAIDGISRAGLASGAGGLAQAVCNVVSAAAVREAGRVIRALPVLRTAGQQLWNAHVSAAQLAMVLCRLATTTTERPGALLLGSFGGARLDSTPGGTSEQQELVLAVVQLVPPLAAALQAAEAGSECGEGELADFANALDTVAFTIGQFAVSNGGTTAAQPQPPQQQQLPRRQLAPAAATTAAGWVAALDAGLQLLPLAARHRAAWHRLGQEGAAALAKNLLVFFWPCGANVLQATPSELLPASSPQLWQLHSRACRAVHWLVQPERAALLRTLSPGTSPAGVLRIFTQGVHLAYAAAAAQPATASGETQTPARTLCAEHWTAVQAAQPLLVGDGSSDSGGGRSSTARSEWLSLLSCLAAAVVASGPHIPPLLDADTARLLCKPVEPRQDLAGEERQAMAGQALDAYAGLLWERRLPARLVASWLASGLLGRLLQRERVPTAGAAGAIEALELEGKRLHFCSNALAVLREAARQLPPPQQQAAAELQAAMHAVLMLPLDRGGASPPDYNAFIDGLLRTVVPAQRVAALLLQHWARPEQVAADRLVLAQAAAARSCANLRCANLGLEGGPAAGQGRGCKRCSACRAVYYCGTACSHADWRAGHRRVCAALGVARQAPATGS
ncbi:hypothetical protein ABPG75_010684 [Micractinium tetrahymenae]